MGWLEDLSQIAEGFLNVATGNAGAQQGEALGKDIHGGGGKSAPQGHQEGNWKGRFHADDIINDVFTGLTPEQTTYVRNTLAQQGVNEQSDPKAFRQALSGLADQIPGLKTKLKSTALFGDAAGSSQPDPLAFQMFFNQTIAPYLQSLASEDKAVTAPLYAQLKQHAQSLPGQYKNVVGAYLPAMEAGQENVSTALRGAAASAPGLDALMKNVTAARSAAEKAYYESIAAKSSGTSATGGLDPTAAAALQKALGK